MDKEPILDTTRRLLAARKQSLPKIAASTGLDFEWLSKMSQGRINDPGVQKVQKLHDYLITEE